MKRKKEELGLITPNSNQTYKRKKHTPLATEQEQQRAELNNFQWQLQNRKPRKQWGVSTLSNALSIEKKGKLNYTEILSKIKKNLAI